MKRLAAAVVLGILTAFVASGCLWGVVRDGDSGAGVSGVFVSYTDAEGHTDLTTTNAKGLYSFDQASGPVPAPGAATFQLSAPGYRPESAPRVIEYNDNPNASLETPSSFWEVQHFDLVPLSGPTPFWQLTGIEIGPGFQATTTTVTVISITNNGTHSVANPAAWLWCAWQGRGACAGQGSG